LPKNELIQISLFSQKAGKDNFSCLFHHLIRSAIKEEFKSLEALLFTLSRTIVAGEGNIIFVKVVFCSFLK